MMLIAVVIIAVLLLMVVRHTLTDWQDVEQQVGLVLSVVELIDYQCEIIVE
jgi:hypothetical protein